MVVCVAAQPHVERGAITSRWWIADAAVSDHCEALQHAARRVGPLLYGVCRQ